MLIERRCARATDEGRGRKLRFRRRGGAKAGARRAKARERVVGADTQD